MKTKTFFIINMLFWLYTNLSYAQILNDAIIAEVRRVDWSQAGLIYNHPVTGFSPEAPVQADNIVVINKDSTLSVYQQIVNAINTASGTRMIFFPGGVYEIDQPVVINNSHSNIIFEGAGAGATILKFTVGEENDCIRISGTSTGNEENINNVSKNSMLLTRSSSDFSMFSANDWIHLCEKNYPYGGSDIRFVGQVTQLSTINVAQTQATMKDSASKDYLAANTLWIQKIYPIMNVGIENLKIERLDEDHSLHGAYINFNTAVNCWVKGVESYFTSYNHLSINCCSHIEISGNYIHEARCYGEYDPPLSTRGTGYGMSIGTSSTNCLVKNNIWRLSFLF